MNHTTRPAAGKAPVRTRLRTAWDTRRTAMRGPRRDLGMETLEKLILGAVVMGAAAAFVLAFNGKFTELMAAFKGAF